MDGIWFNEIYRAEEERFEVLLQRHESEKADRLVKLDQQIHITLFASLGARNGSEEG